MMAKTFSFFLLAFFLLGGSAAEGQSYHPVDKSSSIKVTVKNAGMDVEGKLTGLEGEISFNPADLKSASFSISVDAKTINTGIDVRDESLRGEEYLNTGAHPRISFVSKQVTQVRPGSYLVKGTLTIRGISKDINLPFTAVQKEDGLLFSGECRVSRMDYKIGVGSLVLSDGMQLSLKVFAKKI
jgi:polyisoprenoid-binding protein YceI